MSPVAAPCPAAIAEIDHAAGMIGPRIRPAIRSDGRIGPAPEKSTPFNCLHARICLALFLACCGQVLRRCRRKDPAFHGRRHGAGRGDDHGRLRQRDRGNRNSCKCEFHDGSLLASLQIFRTGQIGPKPHANQLIPRTAVPVHCIRLSEHAKALDIPRPLAPCIWRWRP